MAYYSSRRYSFSNPLPRSYSSSGLSRSGSRSGGLQRSYSFSGSGSLRRSPSQSVFGRSLADSSHYYTPPLHSVAVQRSTPHYSDRYPYVRYSYGRVEPGLAIMERTASSARDHYTQRMRSTRGYLESKYTSYATNLQLSPYYGAGLLRYGMRMKNPSHLNVEGAVDLYKSRCMTIGTLSKYWLTPTTWKSRLDKERNLGRSLTGGNYSYTNRYTYGYTY